MDRIAWLFGLVGLWLAANPAAATPVSAVFAYTGGFQSFTAPVDGLYRIVASGAQGGGTNRSLGYGAEIGGDFFLSQSEVLAVAVGGSGTQGLAYYAAGGGGGTFVVAPGNLPLVIAGGGGGAGDVLVFGDGGHTGTSGGGAAYSSGILYGTDGHGGPAGVIRFGTGPAGGGGFTSGGQSGTSYGVAQSAGGASYFDGLAGGIALDGSGSGGFGGGGSADGVGGGGGGGYSGGSGGFMYFPGNGGGSLLDASVQANADVVLIGNVHTGNGAVTIDLLADTGPTDIPEPAGLSLLGIGLAASIVVRRRGLLNAAL